LHACIISLCRCRDYGHVHHGKRVSGTRTRCARLPEHALAWHPLVRHRVLPGFVPSILKGDIAIVSEAMLVACTCNVACSQILSLLPNHCRDYIIKNFISTKRLTTHCTHTSGSRLLTVSLRLMSPSLSGPKVSEDRVDRARQRSRAQNDNS
jgi:hypothetical protein